MTVFKRKDRDGQWNYDFWFNKERYRGICIDPDTGVEAEAKSGAKLIEAAIKRQVRQQAGFKRAQIVAGKYTFAQAIAGHRDTLAGITTEAKANVEIYLRDLEAYFGSTTPVVEITKLDIERYRSRLASQTVKVWLGGKQKADASRTDLWRDTGRRRAARTNNYYLKRMRYILTGAHETQDPLTGVSALPFPPKVKLFTESKRVPRPMPDTEFADRHAEAKPWTRDAMDLARKFGLRRREALMATVHHINRERRGLFFSAEEVKADEDQFVYGGDEGYELLQRLEAQAKSRGQRHLVTWPGSVKNMNLVLQGIGIPSRCWKPLKNIKRSFKSAAKRAGIENGHRFHDQRARYVTEVSKVASASITQKAARHADPSTTAMYIGIASDEVATAVNAASTPKSTINKRSAG